MRALRRDTDGTERIKTEATQQGSRNRRPQGQATARRAPGRRSCRAARDGARSGRRAARARSNAELEELRSELEARKTLIKSLRSDQERVAAVCRRASTRSATSSGSSKPSINKHSNTIAELRRSADTWKRKYHAVKGDSPTATTSVTLPTLSDTDVRVIEHIEKTGRRQERRHYRHRHAPLAARGTPHRRSRQRREVSLGPPRFPPPASWRRPFSISRKREHARAARPCRGLGRERRRSHRTYVERLL